MKRTLTLFLMSAIASCALAQTPKVVEKTVTPVKDAAAARNKQVAAVSAQSPAPQVKVIAVPAAKPSAAVAKSSPKPAVQAGASPAAKPAVIAVQPAPKANAAMPNSSVAVAKTSSPAKPAPVAVVPAKAPATGHAAVVKVEPAKQAANKLSSAAPTKSSDPFNKPKAGPAAKVAPAGAKAPVMPKGGTVVAVNENKPMAEKKPEVKKISAVGRRDPFVSPVVHMTAAGSGCSSGKRCLAIDQIALKGVVRSENGMIAVVVNSMSKAYFLRENDPVFNGYVTRITPDSVTFKETFHDKLGKELTRDVVKTISRPAA